MDLCYLVLSPVDDRLNAAVLGCVRLALLVGFASRLHAGRTGRAGIDESSDEFFFEGRRNGFDNVKGGVVSTVGVGPLLHPFASMGGDEYFISHLSGQHWDCSSFERDATIESRIPDKSRMVDKGRIFGDVFFAPVTTNV